MKAILQVINQMRQKILSGKRESRKKLAALSFAQKLVLLEKLRDRSLLIASSSLRQRRQHAQRTVATPIRDTTPGLGPFQLSASPISVFERVL
jgi:hypothetical protein